MRKVVLALLPLAAVACSVTPTAPTIPTSGAGATAAVMSARFTPDPIPAGNSVAVASNASAPNTLWLGIVAESDEPVYIIRGHIYWDPNVLAYDEQWKAGVWYQGPERVGGKDVVDWAFTPSNDRIWFFPTRPTMGAGAAGGGDVIWFRFRALRPGQTRVTLRDLEIFGRFAQPIVTSVSGGLVVVQ